MIDRSGLHAHVDPAAFYEAAYDPVLTSLIGQVLDREAPISESQLVQRIARAHGFQRSGRVIRDRVIAVVEREFHLERDDGSQGFVWPRPGAAADWSRARPPISERDIRQIEDIAFEELRAADGRMSPSEVARFFGIRRLTTMARTRIEQARGIGERPTPG
jgi:hypothetical protein